MRSETPPDGHAELLVAIERATAGATPATIVRLLGDLERFKAILWQRLLLTATAPVVPAPSDPSTRSATSRLIRSASS